MIPHLRAALDDAESVVPNTLRPLLAEGLEEIRLLEGRIHLAEKTLEALADHLPAVAQLQTIPGVGPLTSTALVAFVGDVRRFPSARHFASYLGLTPASDHRGRPDSSGRSPSAAIPTSACSSSTALAPCSGERERRTTRDDSAPGRSPSR